MVALGLAPELLTHPPVPHPLVDPGEGSFVEAHRAPSDAPASA
jgi:hypothetical protein